MGAFCVFGVSWGDCLKRAQARVKTHREGEKINGRYTKEEIPREEWLALVDIEAKRLFSNAAVKQISPAFDAPTFCLEWAEIGKRGSAIARAQVMAKGQKHDKKGRPMLRKGNPVIGWVQWDVAGNRYLEARP